MATLIIVVLLQLHEDRRVLADLTHMTHDAAQGQFALLLLVEVALDVQEEAGGINPLHGLLVQKRKDKGFDPEVRRPLLADGWAALVPGRQLPQQRPEGFHNLDGQWILKSARRFRRWSIL